MMQPSLTIGIEEEYLLVDRNSLALAEAPAGLMGALEQRLGEQVSPEYLKCQVEVGTRKSASIDEARDDLRRLRMAVSEEAGRYDLAPIAVSCHPSADWKNQHHTDKERYNELREAMGAAVRRLLICGMHVHVGLDDDKLRVDLMAQQSYFLPHILALSVSSPFWKGEDTGLSSYRLGVFDNLPRTGLPPHFESFVEYQRMTDRIKEIDEEKGEALAEAPWPVEGMELLEDGLLLNGLPFEQASTSQRIMASVKVGMALNPTLRLLVCEHGSDLDLETLEALEKVAKENDFQLIVEIVTRTKEDMDRCAVVIHDGAVVSDDASDTASVEDDTDEE